MIPHPETVQTLQEIKGTLDDVYAWLGTIEWTTRQTEIDASDLREACSRCATSLDSLLSSLPQREWQPISSAPKDGTQVLVIVAGGKRIVASWNIQFDDWQEDALSYAFVPIEPLLWHPLPDLPAPPVDTEPT